MSVSGVPSTPAGFDVLFPSGNVPGTSSGTSSAAPSSTGTSSAAPSSQIPSNIPGADVLNQPFNGATVPGFDILSPASYFPGAAADTSSSGSSTSGSGSATSPASSAPQTIQQEYDNFEASVNQTLLGSVEGNTPSIPSIGGQSASSFASLNSLLAALAPLNTLNAQAANAGTSSAAPSSNASNSTGSTIDALA